MLSRIIALWPRTEGQGWKPKSHEQIHVPDDIPDNGSPQGSHSGPLEHNHIDLVKRPTNCTQKRRVSLDKQLGERIYEKYVLQAAGMLKSWDACFGYVARNVPFLRAYEAFCVHELHAVNLILVTISKLTSFLSDIHPDQ